ncbi:hypothetical protein E2C01_024064 [Portunus trituberculatus]|uniref:Uncharacterized protein n=1 Tax=Portunus trituberculatus TaxID=210409 RepID=A0A5B7EBQ1_PORTR|nr:hypothetical protein [Portunus trituberculatus]
MPKMTLQGLYYIPAQGSTGFGPPLPVPVDRKLSAVLSPHRSTRRRLPTTRIGPAAQLALAATTFSSALLTTSTISPLPSKTAYRRIPFQTPLLRHRSPSLLSPTYVARHGEAGKSTRNTTPVQATQLDTGCIRSPPTDCQRGNAPVVAPGWRAVFPRLTVSSWRVGQSRVQPRLWRNPKLVVSADQSKKLQ